MEIRRTKKVPVIRRCLVVIQQDILIEAGKMLLMWEHVVQYLREGVMCEPWNRTMITH
ncbi:hypothetical protein [Peptostreptococcus faecalis]|uniref:hypothetical protein n=1 Tax=Peptostreptococcus faecalis TaxID=2045015 RepID=UPI0015E12D36|nr:hypothetical protein [Peptostreptococcus faecalis]